MASTVSPDLGLLCGREWRQAFVFVADLLDAADDDEEFARCGIEQLPRLVASDLTTLSLFDLRTGRRHVFASPSAAIDDDAREAFDRHFRSHPLVRHHAFEGGRDAHRVSDSIAFAEFRHTALYDEYYRRVGIDYAMALPVLVDAKWLVSFVLNRSGRDFSDRDRARVDVLRQPLARLFRRTRLLERVRAGAAEFAPALPRPRELSAREHEVLAWVAAGKTDRDIAAILGVSHRTRGDAHRRGHAGDPIAYRRRIASRPAATQSCSLAICARAPTTRAPLHSREATMAIDTRKLDAFMGRFVGDLGAVMHAATIVLGDRLGLYKALAGGPQTAEELAERTHTDARYVREWLPAQAASGYVDYDSATRCFALNDEQALALTVEDGPAFIPGAFEIAVAQFKAIPKMEKTFRTGLGFGWHEHDGALFRGTERFFRPGYAANLVSQWIPALDGLHEKLCTGAQVADVGCGHGASTIIMAQAYPASRFVGFDSHAPSVTRAAEAARDAGLDDRVHFEVASAKTIPGRGYDLVTMFDCLHDMGDPRGAAAHVREVLAGEGWWLIVEPFANDRLEDNLNPVGRVFYSASSFICTPASRAQEVGLALGAQAGEARIREVVNGGGCSRFRRATQTPFNLVFEARP